MNFFYSKQTIGITYLYQSNFEEEFKAPMDVLYFKNISDGSLGQSSIQQCLNSQGIIKNTLKVNSKIKLVLPQSSFSSVLSLIGVEITFVQDVNGSLTVGFEGQNFDKIVQKSKSPVEGQLIGDCAQQYDKQIWRASVIIDSSQAQESREIEITFSVPENSQDKPVALLSVKVWTNCKLGCDKCLNSTKCLSCLIKSPQPVHMLWFDKFDVTCPHDYGCEKLQNCNLCYNDFKTSSLFCAQCSPYFGTNFITGECFSRSDNPCPEGTYLWQGRCRQYGQVCKVQDKNTGKIRKCPSSFDLDYYKCPEDKQIMVYEYSSFGQFVCTCNHIGGEDCLQCSVDDVCTNCAKQTVFNHSINSCVPKICPEYSYFSANSICEPCPSGCLHCDSKNCFQCSDKMQYFSGQICQPCPIENCSECHISGQFCLDCAEGYKADAQQKVCKPFCSVDHCTTCIQGNSFVCMISQPHYFIDPIIGIPKECSNPTCLTCSPKFPSECLTCEKGLILTSSKSCVEAKLNHCRKCRADSSQLCDECDTGYLLTENGCKILCQVANCEKCVENSSNQCLVCQTSFILDSSTFSCQLCSVVGCVRCESGNQAKCSECKSNFVLNPTSKTCVGCLIDSCISCNKQNPKICEKCLVGFELDALSSHCSPTNKSNCNLFNQSNPEECLSCVSPFILHNKKCVSCQLSNCLECHADNANKCNMCELGFSVGYQSQCCGVKNCQQCEQNNTTCRQCSEGYFLDKLFKTCSSCSLSNCENCLDASHCEKCTQGYNLSSSGSCELMCSVSNCKECQPQSQEQCKTCNQGFYLTDDSFSQCIPCQIPNCQVCSLENPKICSQCVGGYKMAYLGSSCFKCSIPHCVSCKSESICSLCEKFFFLNTSTGKCESQCRANYCVNCWPSDNTKCLSCKANFRLQLQDNSCVCGLANCSVCDQNIPGKCNSCNDRYFLDSNSICQKTCPVQNCQTCQLGKPEQCAICAQGYFLNAPKSACIPQCRVLNCLICSQINTGKCQICEDGFVLNDRQTLCQKQPCLLPNCIACYSSDTMKCTSCQDNYSLNSQGICVLQWNGKQQLNYFNLTHQATNLGYRINIMFEEPLNSTRLLSTSASASSPLRAEDILYIEIEGIVLQSVEITNINSSNIDLDIIPDSIVKGKTLRLEFKEVPFVIDNKIDQEEKLIDLPIFLQQGQYFSNNSTRVASDIASGISKGAAFSTIAVSVLSNFYIIVNFIDFCSFLFFLLLIQIRTPANLLQFSQIFNHFQYPYFPNIFERFLVKPGYDQMPPSSKFVEMEVSGYFLIQVGQELTLILIILLLFLIYYLMSFAPWEVISEYAKTSLKTTWIYNAFLDLFQVVCLSLAFSAVVQFYNYDFSDRLVSWIINYSLQSILFLVVFSVPLLLFHKFYKIQIGQDLESAVAKQSTLINGLRLSGPSKKNHGSCIINPIAVQKEDPLQILSDDIENNKAVDQMPIMASKTGIQKSSMTKADALVQEFQQIPLRTEGRIQAFNLQTPNKQILQPLDGPKESNLSHFQSENGEIFTSQRQRISRLNSSFHQRENGSFSKISPNKINLSAPVNSQGIEHLLNYESMPSPKEINIPLSEQEEGQLKENPQTIRAKCFGPRHFRLVKYYLILLMFRKIIFSLIIVILYKWPYLQLILLIQLNVFIFSYIVYINPFENTEDKVVAIISEILFLAIQIVMLFLVQDDVNQQESTRVQLGWIIIALFFIIIICNFYLIIKAILLSVFSIIKLCFVKNVLEDSLKEAEELAKEGLAKEDMEGGQQQQSDEDKILHLNNLLKSDKKDSKILPDNNKNNSEKQELSIQNIILVRQPTSKSLPRSEKRQQQQKDNIKIIQQDNTSRQITLQEQLSNIKLPGFQ